MRKGIRSVMFDIGLSVGFSLGFMAIVPAIAIISDLVNPGIKIGGDAHTAHIAQTAPPSAASPTEETPQERDAAIAKIMATIGEHSDRFEIIPLNGRRHSLYCDCSWPVKIRDDAHLADGTDIFALRDNQFDPMQIHCRDCSPATATDEITYTRQAEQHPMAADYAIVPFRSPTHILRDIKTGIPRRCVLQSDGNGGFYADACAMILVEVPVEENTKCPPGVRCAFGTFATVRLVWDWHGDGNNGTYMQIPDVQKLPSSSKDRRILKLCFRTTLRGAGNVLVVASDHPFWLAANSSGKTRDLEFGWAYVASVSLHAFGVSRLPEYPSSECGFVEIVIPKDTLGSQKFRFSTAAESQL